MTAITRNPDEAINNDIATVRDAFKRYEAETGVDPSTLPREQQREIALGGLNALDQGANESQEASRVSDVLAQWQRKMGLMRQQGRPADFMVSVPSPTVLRTLGILSKNLELTRKRWAAIRQRHPDVPDIVFDNLPALLSDPLAIYVRGGQFGQGLGETNVVVEVETSYGEPILVGFDRGQIRTITPRNDRDGKTGAERLAVEVRGSRVLYARNEEALNIVQGFEPPQQGTIPNAPESARSRLARKVLLRTDIFNGASAPLQELYQSKDPAAGGVSDSGAALNQSGDDGFSEEGRKQARDVERAYGGRQGYERDKAAGRTKLTYGQWVQVRTPNFLRWFGDWLALQSRAFLDGKPVATLTGAEFASDGVPLTEKVPKWYADNGFSTVAVDGIGDVALDARAVKDSFSHRKPSRERVMAFAAVPDVLKKGRIISVEPLEGSRDGGMVYQVAAPVSMGGKDYIVDVMVKADPKSRRMYVHEVIAKEKLQQVAFKTGADAAEAGAHTGADTAGAIRSVLQAIYEVNPATVSKVIDPETLEPMVVYHATNGDFNAFSESKRSDGFGYYFGLTEVNAKKAATGKGRIIAAFIKADKVAGSMKTPAADWLKMRFDGIGRRLAGEGFDAAYIKDEARGALVVRNPNQIKSATANNGDFSEDPNILKQADGNKKSPRGQIVGRDGQSIIGQEAENGSREFNITLFEGKDLSTVLRARRRQGEATRWHWTVQVQHEA